MTNLISGYATDAATQAYAKQHEEKVGKAHFSDFPDSKIKLSSIGIGTYGGAADEVVDAEIGQIVSRALQSGINVIDTAAHYRYGRSLVAIRAGLLDALSQGFSRDSMFLVSKGGFLTFRGGVPEDFENWFDSEIVQKNLGSKEDLVNQVHLLSAAYIDYQIDLSRQLMGVETLDAFLVDQPEIHIPVIGKEVLNQKLLPVFTALEKAVAENRIRHYGISTFEGMRVETDHAMFQSITSMQGLAEKAAQAVTGETGAQHHFKLIQMPFNMAMTEAFTRFNQATGQGNVSSSLQAAYQLGVYVMTSHTMLKGHLATQTLDEVRSRMPGLVNPAQYAIQFSRSTPGIGSALVGLSHIEHLNDALSVAQQPPMGKQDYLSLYQKN